MDEPYSMPGERSHTQKATCCMFPYIRNFQTMQINRNIDETLVFQRLVGGGNGELLLMYMQFLLGAIKIFLNSGDDCIAM